MANPNHRHRSKPHVGKSTRPTAAREGTKHLSRIEVGCWAALLAISVGMLIWKHCASFFYSWSDEPIHLYVARRLAEGAVLYRDIESARPPLVLFPVALLIKMGCAPLFAGRALVLASQLASAGLVLWGGSRLGSFRVGALAALLFLSAPESFARIHYTGSSGWRSRRAPRSCSS